MRKLLTLAVFGLTLAAGYSLASNPGMGSTAPRDQWLPLDKIQRTLRSDGYEVREIEVDDGAYEFEATSASGVRVEACAHPATGEVLTGRR